MNELALFAGAGGGILGGHMLGWRTVCAVEFDAYARSVLLARQRDGCLPRFPVWDDVRTFDGKPWRGRVDVVSGGFPCQDISAAGKGAGIDGERSGLWREMARIVGEVRPRCVWVENSPLLVSRGLAVVLGGLAQMGYDARWGVVGAHHAGAPHKRDRCWIMADSASREDDIRKRGIVACSEHGRKGGDSSAWSGREDVSNPNLINGHDSGHGTSKVFGELWQSSGVSEGVANRFRQRLEGQQQARPETGPTHGPGHGRDSGWWQSEPQLGRVADGLAAGMDVHGTHAGIDVGRVATGIPKRSHRLRCIGNGQVPTALVMAWNELTKP